MFMFQSLSLAFIIYLLEDRPLLSCQTADAQDRHLDVVSPSAYTGVSVQLMP